MPMLEAFLVSTGLVALAEIGDKTQLLSLVLSARLRKPWPIVAGILVATLLNHGAAGALGAWITHAVGESLMTKIVGVSFLAMAAWVLVPDKLDDKGSERNRGGVFLTTATLFFIAEMGDKTQVATVMLAARYESLVAVVLGTTLGMMLANVPVVFFGDAIAKRFPLATVRKVTAVLFAVLGIFALIPQAHAQELTVAAGATRTQDARDTTYAWLISYSHELSPHLTASYAYRNKGHVPSHHRDGHSVQLWASTAREWDADGFALRAGVGPYRFFDTTAAENPLGYADAHGWGAIYSLAATWRPPGRRWAWELRAEHIRARASFDSTLVMLGATYELDQDGSLRRNAPARTFGPHENEVALMGGQTIVNSFASEGARAYLVEYRRTLAPAVRATLGWVNEGDARLIRRNGAIALVWLEPSFGDDRFTMGVGVGPYVAVDHYAGSEPSVQALIGTTLSYHVARAWTARISWYRVSSNYDRDSDIIVAGVGYRF
jgi:putative Ca2+/H+ antiporter (TMEM165/GDT1 family)